MTGGGNEITYSKYKSTIFIEVVNNMKKEKELSPFQKMKDAYLSRKENPEIIRPEDMRDDEYLRYTIRKKWREDGKKRSRGWKTLKKNRKNKIRSLNPRQNRVDINNSDTLDGKNPTLKVFDY